MFIALIFSQINMKIELKIVFCMYSIFSQIKNIWKYEYLVRNIYVIYIHNCSTGRSKYDGTATFVWCVGHAPWGSGLPHLFPHDEHVDFPPFFLFNSVKWIQRYGAADHRILDKWFLWSCLEKNTYFCDVFFGVGFGPLSPTYILELPKMIIIINQKREIAAIGINPIVVSNRYCGLNNHTHCSLSNGETLSAIHPSAYGCFGSEWA